MALVLVISHRSNNCDACRRCQCVCKLNYSVFPLFGGVVCNFCSRFGVDTGARHCSRFGAKTEACRKPIHSVFPLFGGVVCNFCSRFGVDAFKCGDNASVLLLAHFFNSLCEVSRCQCLFEHVLHVFPIFQVVKKLVCFVLRHFSTKVPRYAVVDTYIFIFINHSC